MCDTQEEIDRYWNALAKGGDPKAQQCGWLADKFGLSWQIVPSMVGDWLGDHTSPGAQRAMNAILKMKKPDIAAIQQAYDG
jgi:predicted 3-demethylubiquinone-9 3-methyltransferase (glyoxalase superfamily)